MAERDAGSLDGNGEVEALAAAAAEENPNDVSLLVDGGAFFGGFGALVLWFAWFVLRVLLMVALGLGAIWML
jgi:hypothetical protein